MVLPKNILTYFKYFTISKDKGLRIITVPKSLLRCEIDFVFLGKYLTIYQGNIYFILKIMHDKYV